MNTPYNPAEIEASAQEYWTENKSFETKEELGREKFYCLSMLPYPSGDLHMGHVRNYTIGDVITRYQHMKGKNVLQPMGWDAFGLPAENAAIKNELPPAEWTRKNIKRMRKQLEQLGFAYDWHREIATCDPSYYRWEQWLFLQLYKKGLVYRKNSLVNWDPVDNTVLANEQVVDGKGWRSGAIVERREIQQWFLKITDYAEELLAGLDELPNWPEQVKTMQRNWIGRSKGLCVNFPLEKHKNQHIEIFTTRADTIMGTTYIGIAAEHPLALEQAEKSPELKKFLAKCRKTRFDEADIATAEKIGFDLGIHVIHPITKEKLPIWVTNFVLMEYGSGAVMAVPAHDERDFEFAKKYKLPISSVISPPKNTAWDFNTAAYTEYGTLINSGEFDNLKSEKAIKVITEFLEKKKAGKSIVHYRLRDWGISRQRYWGTPIPIIYCNSCGALPVREEDLPVILPEDLIPTGQGSPLADDANFYKTECPSCGKPAKRETDTMDTFVESSWYYTRYCCFDQSQSMLDDRAKYWTPVDQYIGGIEHAVMHLLYARFMHKLLRDLNLVNSSEPFNRLLTQGMVLKDGAKMSKSKGNVVAPQALIKKFGADTVRLFIMFASPPEQSLEWSDSGVEGSHRFLTKLWNFCQQFHSDILALNQGDVSLMPEIQSADLQNIHKQMHEILRQADLDMQRAQFNTVVSASMKMLNLLQKIESRTEIERRLIQEGLSILLRLLAPITPHIAHHLWRHLKFGDNILDAQWPKINSKAIKSAALEMMIQINGKLRGKITIESDLPDSQVKNLVLADESIKRHINDQAIKKIIVVPNRLVNIVV